jgi:hypothetical protein
MRSSLSVAVPLIACILVCSASAGTVTQTAARDTYVSLNPYTAGEYRFGDGRTAGDTNNGSEPYLLEVTDGGYASFAMLWFDLSAYAGLTAGGSGTLSLSIYSTWNGSLPDQQVSTTLSARPVTADWSEDTVTWNSLGGNYGPALDGHTFTVQPGSTISFTIPVATIQEWLSTPSTNHGFLIYQGGGNQTILYSRDSNGGQPQLSFDITPEPATYMLFGGALLGLAILRRRRA